MKIAFRTLMETIGLGFLLPNENEHENYVFHADANAAAEAAEKNMAGRYAHWTDEQKAAASDYIAAKDLGYDGADETEALIKVGITGDTLIEFQTKVSEALSSGDYEVGIEDAWFEPQVESNLQSQLNRMSLNATVISNASRIGTFFADGSHATGLDFVPRDNYIARLHQGVMVLTRNEASEYRAGGMGDTSRLESMMGSLISLMQQMVANQSAGQTVVLDSGVLVGQIAPQMDARLGTIMNRKARVR